MSCFWAFWLLTLRKPFLVNALLNETKMPFALSYDLSFERSRGDIYEKTVGASQRLRQ